MCLSAGLVNAVDLLIVYLVDFCQIFAKYLILMNSFDDFNLTLNFAALLISM